MSPQDPGRSSTTGLRAALLTTRRRLVGGFAPSAADLWDERDCALQLRQAEKAPDRAVTQPDLAVSKSCGPPEFVLHAFKGVSATPKHPTDRALSPPADPGVGRVAVPIHNGGDKAGLLLIHGHPFDRRIWEPQTRDLSDEFDVVAADLPGFGECEPLEGRNVSMRELAESTLAVMDKAGLERPIVVGLSMGGFVAIELAVGAGDRVAALVLVSITAAPVTVEEALQRRSMADLIERSGMLPLVLDMAPKLFGARARRDPETVEPVISMMLRTSSLGAAAALRGRAERPDYRVSFPRFAFPSLVVAGEDDPYIDHRQLQELAASLPECELISMPGVGHLPNLEDPARFNDALRGFAARVSGAHRS